MRNLIAAFLRGVLGLFAPGSGKRRAGARPIPKSPVRRPDAPRPDAVRLPAHRSPYSLHAPLDGAETAMVRPYVLEAERARDRERARQLRRRVALVMAADFGVDLDRHVIGAEAVTA